MVESALSASTDFLHFIFGLVDATNDVHRWCSSVICMVSSVPVFLALQCKSQNHAADSDVYMLNMDICSISSEQIMLPNSGSYDHTGYIIHVSEQLQNIVICMHYLCCVS